MEGLRTIVLYNLFIINNIVILNPSYNLWLHYYSTVYWSNRGRKTYSTWWIQFKQSHIFVDKSVGLSANVSDSIISSSSFLTAESAVDCYKDLALVFSLCFYVRFWKTIPKIAFILKSLWNSGLQDKQNDIYVDLTDLSAVIYACWNAQVMLFSIGRYLGLFGLATALCVYDLLLAL